MAVKLAVVAFAETTTDAGTVNAAVLEDESPTDAPPLGAGGEIVTVQFAVPPELTDAGVHCSPETVEPTLMTPPAPETPRNVPSGKVPSRLLIGTESIVLLLLDESVAVATATMPLAMVFAFAPAARHVTAPTAELQFNVFPAADSAGPAAILSETTSEAGYERVHSKPAGALAAALKERLSESTPPFTADPDANVNDVF